MFEILIAVLVVAGIVVIVQRKLARRPAAPRRDAYVQLLRHTGGDDELADRLVDAERKRNPYAPNERLAELALARWKKDRN